MPPAARVGDQQVCPTADPGPKPHTGGQLMGPGAPTILIEGKPAAVVGDTGQCCGPPTTITSGSTTVKMESKGAARAGDPTAHGGVIIGLGTTVLIGDSPSGGSSSTGDANGGGGGGGSVGERSGPAEDSLEVIVVDFDGTPVEGQSFQITLDSGEVLTGETDAQGRFHADGLTPEVGEISFPELNEVTDGR